MDILTFIASLTSTLTWPITSLIALAILIKKGSKIAAVIKSIKYKDIEINLREDFAAAKEIATQIQIEENLTLEKHTDKNSNPSSLEFYQLANIDPPSAVLKIWQNLEAEIIKLIQHNGLIKFTNPRKFIDHLFDLNKITKEDVELFTLLNRIRNDVVHPSHTGKSTVTVAQVLEYKNFVDILIEALESIRQEAGYINIKQ